ncbi:MAG: discoidin domain-containing protein [Candidatus Aenigmarchaeota archaeon]|nr:discoidin domain-containing protein [Candidatus Aenigmarchaeota archaeon]
MKIGVGRGIYLVLLVVALALAATAHAQTNDAAVVLNQVCDFSKAFVETPSVSCLGDGYSTDYGDNYNPFGITDLDPGTGLGFTVTNPLGYVTYNAYGVIPVINSQSIEGIPLYIEKKYTTVILPDGNLTYAYENNTIISSNILLNVSALTKENDIFSLGIEKIPLYTSVSNPINTTGIILETTSAFVPDPSTGWYTNKTIPTGIEIFNKTLASPDREVKLPTMTSTNSTGGIEERIQVSYQDGTRKDILISDNQILIKDPSEYDPIDSRIQGLVILNETILSAASNTIPIDSGMPFSESVQFVGKIPIISITKNGITHKAIPIIKYTNNAGFNGSQMIGGIPILSPEIHDINSTIPSGATAHCIVSYAKNQLLKGIKIVPTEKMKIDKIKVNGNTVFNGPKNLAAGVKETVFYDTPIYGNSVEIYLLADVVPCDFFEISSQCQNSCRYAGFGNAYHECMDKCSHNACFKARFGFTEINGKVPDLKIEVSSKPRSDPFLESYSQFIPGELISVVGHVDRDTHICPCGSQRWCHDTTIEQCSKHKTGNWIWECTEFRPECPGGFKTTIQQCHHTVCGPGFVGKIIIAIITTFLTGGTFTWVAFVNAIYVGTATIVLTEVLHLPGWLANTLVSLITLSPGGQYGFETFVLKDFLIKAAVNYAVDYIYQHQLRDLLSGGFLEQFVGNVLTRVVAAVGQSIADPTLRADFFAGKLTLFTSDFFKETLLRAGVQTVVSKIVGSFTHDQWLTQFASVVAASQISNIAFKDSNNRLKHLKEEVDATSSAINDINQKLGTFVISPEVRADLEHQKSILEVRLKDSSIEYKSLSIAKTGVMQLGFSKSVELSETTQIGLAAIEYLRNQVQSAGQNGNSIVCEKEYLGDPIFRPNIFQTQHCPKQGLVTTEVYRVQGGALITEAQGSYLCDGNFQSVSDGTLVTLKIINNGVTVKEYTTTTTSLTGIDGFDNFRFNDVKMPELPSNYTLEITAQENYDGQQLSAKYKEEIDVVSPYVAGEFIPKTQCSSGETLDYLLRINSTVRYPVILLRSNEWTPFSLPYVPRVVVRGRNIVDNITLSELSNTCNFQNIMWWNQSKRAFETGGNETNLVAGRGYYIKSSNDCTVFFKSERFFGGSIDQYSGISKPVTLEDVETPGSLVLIGSLSNNYKLNEITYPSCPDLGYTFTNNAPEPREANKMLYIIEAQSTVNPQPPPMSGFSTSVKLVNEIRPGKAYWVYIVGANNCRFTRQISAPPFSGTYITTDSEYRKPDNWRLTTENISDQLIIGQEFLKYISLTPADADKRLPKTFNMSVDFRNETLFISNSARAFYEMTNSDPSVNITEVLRTDKKKEYRISIKNNENPECQNRSYYFNIQAPDAWSGKILDDKNRSLVNLSVSPGSEKSARALISPIGSKTSVSIIITVAKAREISSYEDIFDFVAETSSDKLLYDENRLIFINNLASEKERIGILNTEDLNSINSIIYPGIIYNKKFGNILDIDQNSKYFIYLEKDNDQFLLKKMNKTTFSSEILYNISSPSNITVDENYVYFFNGNLIKLNLDTKTPTILMSGEGITIANDENSVYWTERNEENTLLKKISKAGSSLVIVREIQGNDYIISNLVIDENSIFVAINDQIYGKILKIDKITGSLETIAAFKNAKSLAVDKRWLYVNNDLSIQKIEKSVKSYNYVIPISIPGHNKPDVSIIPKEGVPGEEIEFPLLIRNKNIDSPEPRMLFFIKNISLENKLERSFQGFRCIDDSAWIQNNASSTVYLCVRSLENASFGRSYRFTLTIGTEDPSMDVNITGEYVIRSPGPPFVRILGDKTDQNNFPENTAIVAKNTEAWYTIDVTNTDNSSGEFVFSIAGKEFELYEKYRESPIDSLVLGYQTYDKKGTVSMKIKTIGEDYGRKDYVLRTYNKAHPSIYRDSPLSLIISPCNYNSICNSEDGENSRNCADCSSSQIECLYEDGCDKTTQTGVEFGATLPEVDKFIICRRDASTSRCINEELRNCQGSLDNKYCYCSLSNLSAQFNIARCSIDCVDNSNYYYVLGKTNDTVIKSPTFLFNCPTCLGNSYNELNEWISDKRQQHLTADCCAYSTANICADLCTAPRENYVACRDSISFIIESSKEIYRQANESMSTGLQCAESRGKIENFMRDMSILYNNSCRAFSNQATLRILSIEKDNVTIENNGTLGYYGIVSCNYRKGTKISKVSDCKRIESGKNKTFILNPELGYGSWSVDCTVNGSWFEDCRASSIHDSAQGSLITISYPQTSFKIEDYEALSGINEGKISAKIKNLGISGNAILKCNISSPSGAKSQITGLQTFIEFNKTTKVNITKILEETGLWSVDSCSVYQQNILHDTLNQKLDFLVATSCSNECVKAGYSYGVCSSNPCNLANAQTSYCSNCCCGVVQSSSQCTNNNNSFIRSTEVRWKEGDYVSIDNSIYNYSPVTISKYAVSSSYKIPIEILSKNQIIYSSYDNVNCVGAPYIKITSPRNNSIVDKSISIDIEKQTDAILYIDDLFLGELDTRVSRFIFDTTSAENGNHLITAISCNQVGCSNSSINIDVENNAVDEKYDFSIQPEYRSYTIEENNKLNLMFTLKNIGLINDRYLISYKMNPDWVTSLSSRDIYINKEDEKTINVSIIAGNSESVLELEVYSYGSTVLKKALVNFSIANVNLSSNTSTGKKPSQPLLIGRTSGFVNIPYQFTAESIDPNNKQLRYEWDWNGDGVVDETSNILNSGNVDNRSHVFSNTGVYNIKVRAMNVDNNRSEYSEYLRIVINESSLPSNSIPSQPLLIGRTSGFVNIPYQFTAESIDPNNKQLRYEWDWNGDGVIDETSNILNSGNVDNRSHVFSNTGVYNIKVRAMNVDNNRSEYSEYLRIVIKKISVANTPPQILSIEATPSTVNKDNSITFYSEIADDENDTINAVVCRDKACNKPLCTMNKKNVLGKEIYECSYLVDLGKGYQSYYVNANDGKDISISYGGLFYVDDFVQSIYDFSIDPSHQQNEVIAGNSYTTRLVISNIGNKKDVYDISVFSNKSWRYTTTINGDRKNFVEINPNESGEIVVAIEVPIENIGTLSTQEITAYSRSTRQFKRSYSEATVKDIINRAPSIKSFSTSYLSIPSNQKISFYADINDPDNDSITAYACADRICSNKYCDLINNETYTCSYLTQTNGTYDYYVIAKDSKNLTTISSPKRFWVENPKPPIIQNAVNQNTTINSSNSVINEEAENAIDTNENTYWTSRNLPANIIINLGKEKNIIGFWLFSESPARPKTFEIRTSKDCINYFNIYKSSLKKPAYKENSINDSFEKISAKCVMLYITSSENNAPYTSVGSFEIYEDVSLPTTGNNTTTHITTNQSSSTNNQSIQPLNESTYLANNTCLNCSTPENKNNIIMVLVLMMILIIALIMLVLFRERVKEFINKMKLRSYYGD